MVDNAGGVDVGEGRDHLREVEANGSREEDAVGEVVAEGVEIAARAKGDGPGQQFRGLQGARQRGKGWGPW